MPCRDYTDDEDRIENARLVQEQKVKIDSLTEMLCELCSKTNFMDLSQNIRGQYSKHLDDDRKRVKQTLVDKFNNLSNKLIDMTGEELRDLESKLDQIK